MALKNIAKSRIFTVLVILVLFFASSISILMKLVGLSAIGALNDFASVKSLIQDNGLILLPLAISALFSMAILFFIVREQRYLIEREKQNELAASKEMSSQESVCETEGAVSVASTQVDANSPYSVNESSDSKKVEKLEEKIKATEQQLEVAQSVKKQFLANMSHELRTPMNGILGMNELLMGSGLSDRQGRFADSVRRSAESLLGIINDLLDYSRMESDTLLLEKATFNIKELVEDVCDLHAEHAQRKDLELICYIDDSMHEAVSGDSNRIRQLLTNLIANAIKFTKKGEVVVRVKQSECSSGEISYHFDIVDTGVGISPEGQATIFESFTQADESYAREFGGAGLGLFITHKLVSMMGGTISLRSRMGEGSHFTVTINLQRAESTEVNGSLEANLEGLRALIVDDNETNRTILYHQLKSWGISPEAVASGDDALRALSNAVDNERPFDVAILDLHMPVMDGLELTAKIQEDPKIRKVKRMMLTSAVLELDLEHLSRIGISQYISKPARQAQLFSVLADLAPKNITGKSGKRASKFEETYPQLGLHVLLAEDNLINQEVADNMLQNFGCTTEVVSTGQAALDVCENTRFDIILMDCQMPVMDGLEATRRLRAADGINHKTPVIALTANVLSGDKEKCLKSGMNGYLGKPVKQDELYSEVSRYAAVTSKSIETNELVADARKKIVSSNVLPLVRDEVDQSQAKESKGSDHMKVELSEDFSESDSVQVDAGVSGGIDNVINMTAIDAIRRLQRPGKPDLVSKVVVVYLEKSPELVEAIIEGAKNKDSVAVKEAAHSMKSSSAYVGADSLSEKFKQLEHAANSNDFNEVQKHVTSLQSGYDQVAQELNELVVKAA